MKGYKKWVIAIFIAILFLGAGVFGKSINFHEKNIGYYSLYNTTEEIKNVDNVTYTLAINSNNNHEYNSTFPLFEFSISREESEELDKKIMEIDERIAKSTNQIEFQENLDEKINLLKSYGCLPPFFSLDNLTKLVIEISDSIDKEKDSEIIKTEFPIFRSGLPFLGIGPGVFAYVSPLGTTTPFGLWNLTYWRGIGNMTKIYITVNYSGIYISSSSNLIQDRQIEINGPMWKSLWKFVGEDNWVNFTEMNAYGVYMIEALVGHSISYSIACSSLPKPKPRIMIGSFYYFGGPTFPLSFTLYRTYPQPWTTMIDIGIIFSLLGQVIFPFWYEDQMA